MGIYSEISERIRTLRKSHAMSSEHVAEILHISLSAYSKLELNQRRINAENVVKLSELYGVSCDYILTGRDSGYDIVSKIGLDNNAIGNLFIYKDDGISDLMCKQEFWAMVKAINKMIASSSL